MKTKKRMLLVPESEYQNIVNDLDKKGIQNWSSTGAFYFHPLTAAIVFFGALIVGTIIHFLP